ncbi:hypothetical protein HG717_32155 [Rhodococcus erythropolis]|uniref:hypothetical protein n=1 Tax=Rhodococcus erythropolis TaxID=1833 RepID=UPI001C9A5A2C|nr:hypothetical protein [Rhodococcus erythropolis]MBY6388537.1 hypothetical protein [Rhodococcus erythropolis]
MEPARELPVLTDEEKARWQALRSDIREMAPRIRRAEATEEEIQAAFGRLAALDIDNYTLMNALHIPADAGEAYSAGLERILRRIPDGWGRWISHERGWYRLIIERDRRLSKVDPNYVVFRVREKFGTLGYYCAPSIEETYEVRKQFQDAIFMARHASTTTCERCGRNGVLYQRNDWVKRLCEICGDDLGFTRCQRA